MSIVTGDRYLESLVQFVEKTAGHLIEGTLVLKLNPVGLHYVQSRLEALAELESLLDGAPVDYLRAYISDLGDHRALEQLRRILRLLTSLKVVSVLPPPIRDPTPLSLLPFERLRVLELRGCDLSTSAARGLLELRHSLEKFICHNSTDALRHVFASRIAEIKDSSQWNRLSSVSCACNGLVLMDESLQLLPVVETLDLSRNKFTRVDNLRKCVKLKHLDLGFNLLRTIASLKELSCRLVKLVLRNNALTTLRGIENLSSLEGLDLSYNIISNFSELEILSGLSSLKSLWLEGNPLCCARWYRAQVFSFFPHPVEMELDDKKLCRREYWKRHIIIASRQKRPASFGYYFTAKDNARSEVPINTKPKKISRLANIENEDPSVCSDQESVACENEVQVENRLDDEDEIVDLMNKIEFMKRERSVQWLEELKEWINRDPETSVDGAKYSGNILNPVQRNCPDSKTRHKAESSKYVSDSAQASGTERGKYTLESDKYIEDRSAGSSGGQYFDQSGEETSKMFTGHSDVDGIPFVGGNDISQGCMQSSRTEGTHSIQAESSHLVSHLVPEDDRVKMKKTVRPLAAIDVIMESQSSSFCLGSPPHYKEDILQRRQNLEEELLQLSAETYSVASTDSNTSCSDDDTAECRVYTPHTDTSCIDKSSDRSVDDFDFSVYSGGTTYKKRHDVSELKQNGNHSLNSYAQQDPGIVEDGESYPSELLCDYSFSARGNDSVCHVNQDADYLQNRKCRRKSKRRVVSLTDRNNMDDAAAADMLNRSLDASRDDMLDITKRQVSINNEIHSCENAVTTSHSKDGGNIISTKLGSVGMDDLIVNHFNSNLADSLVNETCGQYVRCNSVLEVNSECKESELVVLRSSEQKLYMLLISNGYNGPDTTLSLIGCHKIGDVRDVLVGLGLQIVRVYIGKDATYQFVTRSLEKSRQLFCILDIFDSYNTEDYFTLRSLEHVQVDLFSKNFFGGSHMSIFQYSMVLYRHCTFEENSWLSRSLFVLERYLLVCIEDLLQFGSVTDISPYPSYFSLDSCCSVVDVLEMVIETKESLCVTLALKKVLSKPGNENTTDQVDKTTPPPSVPLTWKLRWFSEESLFQFVALLRALHNSATSSPLVVMYMS